RAAATIREVLSERLELDEIPPEADTEPEVPAGEDVDLGRLLGDERGLPLRKHEHPRDQLERGHHRGQVSEEDEDLVELVLRRIRTGPVRSPGNVGAEHVVVREQVVVPELFGRLGEGMDATRVGSDLGLRENGADAHARIITEQAGSVIIEWCRVS